MTAEAETNMMWPQARNTWRPPGAGEAGSVLLQSLEREHGPAHTLVLDCGLQQYISAVVSTRW